MKQSKAVLFWDSGDGGLNYSEAFSARNPERSIVYFADRAGFPYGEKTKHELESLALERAGQLLKAYKPCAGVLVCNTISVTALALLRREYPEIPWVGTVPAVKPAVIESKTRCIGVLGTQVTVDDPYIMELARDYGDDCRIVSIAAPDLVRFAEEHGAGNETDALAIVKPYVERLRSAGADGIVLGCTHFIFLKDVFIQAASPDMQVYDSVEGVVRQTERTLAEVDTDAGKNKNDESPAQGLLVLSGAEAPGPRWEKRAADYGFSIELLNELH